MFGVVINKYGNESVLNYQTGLKTPQLKPNQVMVEVHASSCLLYTSDAADD